MVPDLMEGLTLAAEPVGLPAAADPAIVADLLDFIAHADPGEGAFDRMALRLFAHQFEHDPAFQRFCRQRGRTPRSVRHWREIPALPIDGFKELTLSCVPPEQCARVFMTSGTTRGDVRGRHYHPAIGVYDRSMTLNFARRFMRGRDRIRMGILFPDEAALPNSSLAHYLALALREFGTRDSRCLMGEKGLDVDALLDLVDGAADAGEPVALLGASYAFVHLADALRERGRSVALPPGSRVLDTGGFKGQSRELDADDFYRMLSASLGIERAQCVNMYGMTELSTQFYDDGNARVPSLKSGPHWIRSRVVDPLTGADMPAGERGILVHCDLANYNAVTTILTEDVGIAQRDGFLLLGRAQGAQAAGCSLAVEDFLRTVRR
jgi:hypothetical protein